MRRYGGEISIEKQEYLITMNRYMSRCVDVDFTNLNNTGTFTNIYENSLTDELPAETFWTWLCKYTPNKNDHYIFDDVQIMGDYIRVKFLASDVESPLLWKDRPVFFKGQR